MDGLLFECSIHNGGVPLKDVRTFKCGHGFCVTCIDKLFAGPTPFSCPICHKDIHRKDALQIFLNPHPSPKLPTAHTIRTKLPTTHTIQTKQPTKQPTTHTIHTKQPTKQPTTQSNRTKQPATQSNRTKQPTKQPTTQSHRTKQPTKQPTVQSNGTRQSATQSNRTSQPATQSNRTKQSTTQSQRSGSDADPMPSGDADSYAKLTRLRHRNKKLQRQVSDVDKDYDELEVDYRALEREHAALKSDYADLEKQRKKAQHISTDLQKKYEVIAGEEQQWKECFKKAQEDAWTRLKKKEIQDKGMVGLAEREKELKHRTRANTVAWQYDGRYSV
ncbi:hypothetical protein M405DRAFT_90344 [Rhizopogon salebrosus TDB-379]|nr:hypothetical protein M405DRAFT_90344 [Rhizopogon salebrosus TDB-379]